MFRRCFFLCSSFLQQSSGLPVPFLALIVYNIFKLSIFFLISRFFVIIYKLISCHNYFLLPYLHFFHASFVWYCHHFLFIFFMLLHFFTSAFEPYCLCAIFSSLLLLSIYSTSQLFDWSWCCIPTCFGCFKSVPFRFLKLSFIFR
jgi:hypothetical protein